MSHTKSPTAVICLSPNNGGMEINSIKMAQKLSPYCHLVLIAQKDSFISKKMEEDHKEIALETIKFRSTLGPALIFNIRKFVRKHGIKNVIFFGASELKSMYFSFLGLDINLMVVHGTTKSHPKKDWFHRLIYSNVRYHVAICDHLAKNVRYIFPFGKKCELKRIYSSFEFKDISSSQGIHTPLRLIHVGRIVRGKGQIDGIKACQVLYDNDIEFEFSLVGEVADDHKQELIATLDNLAYKENIVFTGHVSDVGKRLENSDLFLFPSAGEGLSNAFLEAMSYGLVCIAYNNTSFPELKELGLHFHMAADQDLEDLKSVLLKTVKNITTEKALSFENIKKVKTLFSQEREILEYLELLI